MSAMGSLFGEHAAVAAPIAYEHCLRLLHEMDTDLDEFITEIDVSNYVRKHRLPFSDAEVRSMFLEANSSANGMMDVEQLGKAVSYKFPHRKHNDDWVRLFELAPRRGPVLAREPVKRLTALVAPPLEQEPVRANFEQQGAIMTFSPLITGGGSGLGHTGHSFTAGSAYSAGASTLASRASAMTFSAAPRPLYAGARLGSDFEREHEKTLNRYLTAEAEERPPPEPAPLPSVLGSQSFAFHTDSNPPRCGFAAQGAFARSVEEAQRTSDDVGYKTRLTAEELRARHAAAPKPLYYGLHERDYYYTPCSHRDHIPMRVDGAVTRVTGEKATPALRLMITEGSFTAFASANERAHKHQLYPADATSKPFVTVGTTYMRNRDREIKLEAAQGRLQIADGTEYPPPIAFMNGKPMAYKFRAEQPDPERVPPGAPPFITSTLGRFWPKINQIGEGLGPSVIAAANPPHTCPGLRVQMTENIHHAARSARSGMVSDAYSYPPTMV
jgi:hypothetical protein